MKVACTTCAKRIDFDEGVQSEPYMELRIWNWNASDRSTYMHGYFCSAGCMREAFDKTLIVSGLVGDASQQEVASED